MSASLVEATGVRVPYPGPRPFKASESDLFFGRAVEKANIVSLIIARRTVVLYAESGAGKSSLLHAAVAPALRDRGMDVLPIGRICGVAEADVAAAQGPSNVFVDELIAFLGAGTDDPPPPAQSTIAEYLGSRSRKAGPYGEPADRVLIIDQFEELFTRHVERWHDREDFFRQLQKALDEDPLLHVVLSLRADYVARLDAHSHLLPEGLRCRFQLERLRPAAALEAVCGPLRKSGADFEPGVAEALVESLLQINVERGDGTTEAVPGEFVEPVQLQIVCKGLWDDLPEGVTRITREHVEQHAKVGQVLARFYREAIEVVVRKTSVDEVTLRSWVARELITPAGTRAMVFRGQTSTGGVPNRAVELLEDKHIVRLEWRSGSRWYELSHDLFIRAIESDNRSRYEELAREAAARRGKRLGRLGLAGLAMAAVVFGLVFVLFDARKDVSQQRDLVEETRTQVSAAQARADSATRELASVEDARVAALAALGHDGRIVFTSERDGRSQIYSMSADGSGVVRLSDGSSDDALGVASPDTKRIAFRRRPAGGNEQIWVMNSDGTGARPLTDSGANDTFPSWSPDGKRIAFFSDRDRNFEIYAMDADGRNAQRLTENPAADQFPAWSPDGKRIAFQRDGRIWTMAPDGSSQAKLTNRDVPEFTPTWSPDGKRIAFQGGDDIYVQDLDGQNVVRITADPFSDGAPAWSPDGLRLALRSNRDGNDEIYAVDPDGSNLRRLTNSEGRDRSPHWVGY